MAAPGERTGRGFWATGIVFAANGASYGGFLPRIPEFADRLGLTAQLVGVALFCVAVGSLIGSAIAPWAVARIGPRRTVIGSLTLLAVGVVAGVSTRSIPLAFSAFALAGLGDGLMDVAMNVEAVAAEKRRAESIMHRFHAMWTIGVLGSSLIGAAVAGTVPLPIHIGVVAALVWAAGVRSAASWPHAEAADRVPVRIRGIPNLVLWAAAITAVGMVIEGIPYDWGALFLTERFDTAPVVAGAGVVMVLVGAVIGRLVGDRAVARLGPYRALASFALVAAAGAGVAMTSSTLELAVLGMLVTGFGGAFVFPAMVTLAGTVPGVAPETGVGAVSTVARVGFLVSPLLAGTVAGAHGVPATFLIAMGGAAVTVAWAVAAGRAARSPA